MLVYLDFFVSHWIISGLDHCATMSDILVYHVCQELLIDRQYFWLQLLHTMSCICKLYASQLHVYAIFSSLNSEANHLTFVSVKSSPPSPNKSYALVTQYCCMWQLYVR